MLNFLNYIKFNVHASKIAIDFTVCSRYLEDQLDKQFYQIWGESCISRGIYITSIFCFWEGLTVFWRDFWVGLLAEFSQFWHHPLQCKPWQEDRHLVSTYVNTTHLLGQTSDCQAKKNQIYFGVCMYNIMYSTIASMQIW